VLFCVLSGCKCVLPPGDNPTAVNKYININIIKKWAAEFKCGHTSLEDDPREGRPKSAAPPEIIEQVHDMVLDDGRMKVSEIAETIGISKKRVGYNLHEKLHMKKLCTRWVPCLFTADQKCICVKISEQ
jgi:hypothetical protein